MSIAFAVRADHHRTCEIPYIMDKHINISDKEFLSAQVNANLNINTSCGDLMVACGALDQYWYALLTL
jgi:hypothetical protein